jgi:TonB family protein
MSYRRRLLLSLVLALLAHPLAVGVFLLASAVGRQDAPTKPKQQAVSLRALDARRWAANRGRAAPPLPERAAPLHPVGQVVDVAPGNDREDPNAKYLAETANRVKQQTRAREQTNRYSVAAARNAAQPEVMPSERGRAGGSASTPTASSRFLQGLLAPDGLRPRLSLLEEQAALGHAGSTANSEDSRGAMASSGQAERGNDAPQATTGGGAPNDDLQDLATGDGTFLNTREWKYASFFNRVKQAVSARWDPNGRLRKVGQHGGLDRVTVVGVALRPDGRIADLFVQKSCGLDFLDQEALAAFERAQPFANPPAALVEDGLVRFRFTFSVYSDRLSMQHLF